MTEEMERMSTVTLAQHARQVARLMVERDSLRLELQEIRADRDRILKLNDGVMGDWMKSIHDLAAETEKTGKETKRAEEAERELAFLRDAIREIDAPGSPFEAKAT